MTPQLKEITLRDLIPIGSENAIATAELMSRTGYTDKRALRMDIRKLRIAGEVILSTTKNKGGYYRPKDKDELRKFIRQEEHRAKSIFYALKTARRLLQQSEDQMQLSFQQNVIAENVQREEGQK